MYYVEEISIEQAVPLLTACGLTVPRNVDYTAGAYTASGQLAATASLKADMIQGVAVDPKLQGEDLTAIVLTHLLTKAREKGMESLYLFTRPEKAPLFSGLGFRRVVTARPYASLMEWGNEGIEQYRAKLKQIRCTAEAKNRVKGCGAGVLVINGNPFTRGHLQLIEYAAKRKAQVYVLVVEEDLSLFSFRDRLEMIRRGTADLPNVTVIPGGRYVVSTLTFPSYFTKEAELAEAHAAVDAELFAKCIASSLGADERFIGTEPLSPVTHVYNRMLKERLPRQNIKVTEIPRFTADDEPISASRVRNFLYSLWKEKGTFASFTDESVQKELKKMLPDTTREYLSEPAMQRKLEQQFSQRGTDTVTKDEDLSERSGEKR